MNAFLSTPILHVPTLTSIDSKSLHTCRWGSSIQTVRKPRDLSRWNYEKNLQFIITAVDNDKELAPVANSTSSPVFWSNVLQEHKRALLCVPAAALIATAYANHDHLDLNSVICFFQSVDPSLIPILLAFAHIVAVVLCLPIITVLEITSGFLLGVPFAPIALSASKVFAASLTFTFARSVFHERASKMVSSLPQAAQVARVLDRLHGWRSVFLLRLTPVPSFVNNYFLAAGTRVCFRDYFLGSCAGMPVSILRNTSIGAGMSSLSLAQSSGPDAATLLTWASAAVGVIAAVAVSKWIAAEVLNDTNTNQTHAATPSPSLSSPPPQPCGPSHDLLSHPLEMPVPVTLALYSNPHSVPALHDPTPLAASPQELTPSPALASPSLTQQAGRRFSFPPLHMRIPIPSLSLPSLRSTPVPHDHSSPTSL